MKRYIATNSNIDDFPAIKTNLESLIAEIDEVETHVKKLYRSLPNDLYVYSENPACTEVAAVLMAARYLSQSRVLLTIVKDYGYTDKFDMVRRQLDY